MEGDLGQPGVVVLAGMARMPLDLRVSSESVRSKNDLHAFWAGTHDIHLCGPFRILTASKFWQSQRRSDIGSRSRPIPCSRANATPAFLSGPVGNRVTSGLWNRLEERGRRAGGDVASGRRVPRSCNTARARTNRSTASPRTSPGGLITAPASRRDHGENEAHRIRSPAPGVCRQLRRWLRAGVEPTTGTRLRSVIGNPMKHDSRPSHRRAPKAGVRAPARKPVARGPGSPTRVGMNGAPASAHSSDEADPRGRPTERPTGSRVTLGVSAFQRRVAIAAFT